jgi:hypothetical protein
MKTSTIESKGLTSDIIDTIQNLVSSIPWPKRRLAMAEVTKTILDGKKRAAEDVFGWARKTVTLGLKELEAGIHCEDNISYRHRRRIEDKHPKMLLDIQRIMSPESQAQPSLRTPLLYTNKTAASVRSELLSMGWSEDELPCVRSISNLLNRQNYRLRRVEKAQVQKKTR